ncbi:MAG: hypothetical protein ACKOK7_02180, partial [Solirubrobacterales bacterium]
KSGPGPAVRRPARPGTTGRRPKLAPRQALAGAGSVGAGLLARAFSGRRLILLLGAALIGLVFLQVNLLRINTTMSADVEKAQVLQRDNASKRALIAQMGAGRRVEGAAGGLGMVMPAATEVCYLKIGHKENCPDGLGAAQADGQDPEALAGAPAGETPATDQATTDETVAPATGETGTGEAPAPEPAPAPQPQAPQAAPDAGGISAGPGGGG